MLATRSGAQRTGNPLVRADSRGSRSACSGVGAALRRRLGLRARADRTIAGPWILIRATTEPRVSHPKDLAAVAADDADTARRGYGRPSGDPVVWLQLRPTDHMRGAEVPKVIMRTARSLSCLPISEISREPPLARTLAVAGGNGHRIPRWPDRNCEEASRSEWRGGLRPDGRLVLSEHRLLRRLSRPMRRVAGGPIDVRTCAGIEACRVDQQT